MKDVSKCIVTVVGEQCVIVMDLLTQKQQLFVALSDSGTFRLKIFFLTTSSMLINLDDNISKDFKM